MFALAAGADVVSKAPELDVAEVLVVSCNLVVVLVVVLAKARKVSLVELIVALKS